MFGKSGSGFVVGTRLLFLRLSQSFGIFGSLCIVSVVMQLSEQHEIWKLPSVVVWIIKQCFLRCCVQSFTFTQKSLGGGGLGLAWGFIKVTHIKSMKIVFCLKLFTDYCNKFDYSGSIVYLFFLYFYILHTYGQWARFSRPQQNLVHCWCFKCMKCAVHVANHLPITKSLKSYFLSLVKSLSLS